jgi:hypothetical protein
MNVSSMRTKKVEDILHYLAAGFLRGTTRTGKSDNGELSIAVQAEIRIGVTYVSTSLLISSCLVHAQRHCSRHTSNGFA